MSYDYDAEGNKTYYEDMSQDEEKEYYVTMFNSVVVKAKNEKDAMSMAFDLMYDLNEYEFEWDYN